jgi:hypothetical protein
VGIFVLVGATQVAPEPRHRGFLCRREPRRGDCPVLVTGVDTEARFEAAQHAYAMLR